MRKIDKIKENYRKTYGDDFVGFIECLEADLKPFAELEHYNYMYSDETEENIHTYIFKRTKDLDVEEECIVSKIINTYDEGCITFGKITYDSIYVTIVGTD